MDKESNEEEGHRADDAKDDDDTPFSLCPVSLLLALHHLLCFASDEIEGRMESSHFVGCELTWVCQYPLSNQCQCWVTRYMCLFYGVSRFARALWPLVEAKCYERDCVYRGNPTEDEGERAMGSRLSSRVHT